MATIDPFMAAIEREKRMREQTELQQQEQQTGIMDSMRSQGIAVPPRPSPLPPAPFAPPPPPPAGQFDINNRSTWAVPAENRPYGSGIPSYDDQAGQARKDEVMAQGAAQARQYHLDQAKQRMLASGVNPEEVESYSETWRREKPLDMNAPFQGTQFIGSEQQDFGGRRGSSLMYAGHRQQRRAQQNQQLGDDAANEAVPAEQDDGDMRTQVAREVTQQAQQGQEQPTTARPTDPLQPPRPPGGMMSQFALGGRQPGQLAGMAAQSQQQPDPAAPVIEELLAGRPQVQMGATPGQSPQAALPPPGAPEFQEPAQQPPKDFSNFVSPRVRSFRERQAQRQQMPMAPQGPRTTLRRQGNFTITEQTGGQQEVDPVRQLQMEGARLGIEERRRKLESAGQPGFSDWNKTARSLIEDAIVEFGQAEEAMQGEDGYLSSPSPETIARYNEAKAKLEQLKANYAAEVARRGVNLNGQE